ncbi:MAG: Rrf2 family transcriptional regulator [Candidatus Dadabacteria bacterium]|nr:MAG: Rrf2 family transcriptional regulator [Candidatus Dadabacteria bacterium]
MLSATAQHALKALIALAELEPAEFAGAAAIAKATGAPANYLGKLLQNLSRAGLLESRKGLGGGFRLAKPPSRISLYEIVEPIDRVSRFAGCLMGNAVCSDDRQCALHQRWAAVRDAYLGMLMECTLADVLARRRELGQA